MTLGEWLVTWYDLYVTPSALAPSTKACYNRAIRAMLDSPGFVAAPLEQLSPLVLRRWLLQVAEGTPRAAQLDRVTLSLALRVAGKLGLCRPGLVDEDVCPQIVHQPAETAILTLPQLRQYMAAAALDERAAPVLLLCCCGLRRGEAMGARWSDVDLAAATLAIRVQRMYDEPLPLKSKASLRVIRLPAEVCNVLRAWPRSDLWVCGCTQHAVYSAHRRILRDLDLPAVTLHGLRHSMATAAALRGQPIKLIQAALGHAHYALTADLYASHLPSVAEVTGRFLTA